MSLAIVKSTPSRAMPCATAYMPMMVVAQAPSETAQRSVGEKLEPSPAVVHRRRRADDRARRDG